MKYDINSRIPKDWNDGNLGKFLKDIKEWTYDTTLTNEFYIIDRYNLLKNDDIVEYDQKPHADDACRPRKL